MGYYLDLSVPLLVVLLSLPASNMLDDSLVGNGTDGERLLD